jgi:hypothetical protein
MVTNSLLKLTDDIALVRARLPLLHQLGTGDDACLARRNGTSLSLANDLLEAHGSRHVLILSGNGPDYTLDLGKNHAKYGVFRIVNLFMCRSRDER